MTIDQLSYVLQRKFLNIEINNDVIIAVETSHDVDIVTGLVHQRMGNDAYILDWRLTDIDRPSDEDLNNWWEILKDQYHSDPYRPDSEMAHFLNSRSSYKIPIIVNEDI